MGRTCGPAVCLGLWARFFLLLAMEQADAAGQVQCLNNYGFQGRRVDCQWHRNQALGETLFYLNFSDSLGLSSDLICPLSASPGTLDHFSCSAYSEEGEFTENDEYKVVLHASSLGEHHTDIIFLMYKPRLHIECDPPFDLQSKCVANKCRVQWKRPKGYEILEDWQWELAFKAIQEPWEQAQRRVFISTETWVDIEGFEFKNGRDYVARMRCKTPDVNKHYGSQWSPWSSSVTWKVHPGDWQQPDAHLPRAALVYFLLCLGTLMLFLALAFTIFKRAKRGCRDSIPTPAAFFQPLYLAHGGNFKGWAGLAAAAADEDEAAAAAWRRSGGEAAVSRLSFLQPSTCASPGRPKRRTSQSGGGARGEELRPVPGAGAVLGDAPQEPERTPGDYCTLGGAGGAAALIPVGWPPQPPPPGPAAREVCARERPACFPAASPRSRAPSAATAEPRDRPRAAAVPGPSWESREGRARASPQAGRATRRGPPSPEPAAPFLLRRAPGRAMVVPGPGCEAGAEVLLPGAAAGC